MVVDAVNTDTVVDDDDDDALVAWVDHRRTVTVECGGERTIDRRSTLVSVEVVDQYPSFVAVSCDEDVAVERVDIHDEPVRIHHRSIRSRDIHPLVDLVAAVAMFPATVDTEEHIRRRVDHENNRQDTGDDDSNWRSLSNCPTIHNCQSYCVLRQPRGKG